MASERLALFRNKSVLITGGTGSFGRAFARKLIREGKPHRVIIFSRDEWKQWEMRNTDPLFTDATTRYFLGDVRDHMRLLRAFHEVDIVVHAAALKQVPAAEYNPTEFIQTNVNGAMNIINAALDSGVKQVIALSSDKAVNPVNLYGATKLCSDKLFLAANVYAGSRPAPQFSVVRYGNVLQSRGSVIDQWRKQLKEGATSLSLTDPQMTRFWLTLDQAVDFTIHSLARMQGGEIFIPKVPSMRLVDLAEAVAPGIPHTFTGIREGEKLNEILISRPDARHTLSFDDHFVTLPEMVFRDKKKRAAWLKAEKGELLPENFSYSSKENSQWLSVDEMRRLLRNI